MGIKSVGSQSQLSASDAASDDLGVLQRRSSVLSATSSDDNSYIEQANDSDVVKFSEFKAKEEAQQAVDNQDSFLLHVKRLQASKQDQILGHRALALLCLALVSAFTADLQLAITWNGISYDRSIAQVVLCGIISACTLIMEIILINYYYVSLRIEEQYLGLKKGSLYLLWNNRTMWMIVEMLIVLIHSPPYLWQYIPEAVNLAVSVRLYLIFRYIHVTNSVVTRRVGFFHAMGKKCTKFDYSGLFTLRVICNRYFLWFTVLLFIFVFQVFSYCFWIVERNSNFLVANLSNSCWIIIITMLTVGYGDYYAVTTAGRCVSLAAGLLGVLCISAVVGTALRLFSLTKQESVAESWVLKETIRHNMPIIAAKIIQFSYRHWRDNVKGNNRNYSFLQLLSFVQRAKFSFLAEKFSEMRETLRSYHYHDEVYIEHAIARIDTLMALMDARVAVLLRKQKASTKYLKKLIEARFMWMESQQKVIFYANFERILLYQQNIERQLRRAAKIVAGDDDD